MLIFFRSTFLLFYFLFCSLFKTSASSGYSHGDMLIKTSLATLSYVFFFLIDYVSSPVNRQHKGNHFDYGSVSLRRIPSICKFVYFFHDFIHCMLYIPRLQNSSVLKIIS